METEMFMLTVSAHFAAQRATRRGDILEAERWVRLADRYANTLLKLKRYREKPAEKPWWKTKR